MKKNLRALLALALSLLLTLPLAGCGEEPVPEIPDYPVTASGVSIEKAPRVVGSLSSALTDLLLELGYQRQIIAYSDEDTIPNPLPEEPESEWARMFRSSMLRLKESQLFVIVWNVWRITDKLTGFRLWRRRNGRSKLNSGCRKKNLR